MDRLQPDSISMSSEASSQAAKIIIEEAVEAPVCDRRCDLLDAIRKGYSAVFHYLRTNHYPSVL